MKKSLVTGGAGFIGSHLTEALVDRGDHVVVLDNLSTGKRQHLSAVDKQIDFQRGDIRDQPLLESLLQGVELVFHQAAFVSVPLSLEEPDECFAVNTAGTVNLISAARKAGVRRLVIASSAAVYGDEQQVPLGEKALPRPLSPYAASKAAGEIYAGMNQAAFDFEIVALRYFNVYGPRQSPDSDYAAAIPIFIDRLLDRQSPVIFGDGGQTRDFVYVRDVVRANLLAADIEAAAGRTLNICSGEETSILQLVELLEEILNSDPGIRYGEERPGDIYRSVGDPARAVEILGFRPQVSLRQGLKETASWMAEKR